MNERDFRTNSNERGQIMPNPEPNAYRRAFWIALLATVVLAVVASVLWWRLSHGAAMPQSGTGSPTDPMHGMTQTSSANIPNSEPGAAGEMQTGNMQETPLAPIQLTPQRMQSIGIVLGKVESKPVNSELRFYGNVQVDERRQAYVQTRFAGWIRKVYADATGNFIGKGQPLFTIYSPDLVSTEHEYLLAKKNSESLQQSKVSGVASGASSLFSAAKERLLQWDVSPAEIEKLDQGGKVITDLTVNSPVSGYITQKNALPNMYVQPETMLYTVADLSDVWVLAQVFQSEAGKIKPGDPAEVTVDAYPGRVFNGRVDYILPQLDMNTRTLPVRLVFANPGLKLRPGMYVNVRAKLPMGRQLVVPASAAFHSGTKNLLFVYSAEGSIEPREVELGPQVGDELVVTKGIKAQEQIVTSANFLIDSEAQLQAAAGAFVPPPPGAGQAASMNAPAEQQANVELTTDPDPPHKGSNIVRVKLTGQDGKPITGANVTVTFFMAAMPAMGMAAMKTVVNANDKGGGMYEGKGDLGSGGTWQVTIRAQQNGQVIIHTNWEGEPPSIIEDQVTYPIVTALLAAPKVKAVRAQTMFNDSYVFVVFEDGTDIYWARSRVVEYLQTIAGRLPANVHPAIGSDATGAGWVYEYALVDRSHKQSLADLRSIQDWHLRYQLATVPGVAEVASIGGFVRQYQVNVDPNKLLAYGIPLSTVIDRVKSSTNEVGGRVLELSGTRYMIRGLGYLKSLDDLANVPVMAKNGTPVLIKDLSTVAFGPDIREGVAEWNGEGETVGGIVVMRYGLNALNVI